MGLMCTLCCHGTTVHAQLLATTFAKETGSLYDLPYVGSFAWALTKKHINKTQFLGHIRQHKIFSCIKL